MVDFEYLYKGLCGLARAHRANGLAGHLGAALLAGYFFGEDHADLNQKVYTGIEKELDRVLHGDESLWFDPKKTGITIPELFTPFPKERPRKELIAGIAAALAGNIGQTRQSGHNVIFAALAIRALHDHPQYATPSIVGGIVKLIKAFDGAVPGRGYYGRKRGWMVGDKVLLPADPKFPPYKSQRAMIEIVVNDEIRFASVRRRGFGGLFHIINHAAGLTDLSRFGYQKLAKQGLAAHRQHVRLWRTLPDVEQEFGPLKRAAHDPRTPEFWKNNTGSQWSAWLTHRVKTLYGFFTLLRFVEEPDKRKQAEDKFRYLMG